MFCSNCGKTIRLDDGACQHCGATLGEGLFYGNTYTSCQVRIPADSISSAPEGGQMAYTRTSYMSFDNQPKDNVYSNTVYRPLLSDDEDLDRIEAEEAAHQAEEAAAQAEEEEAARQAGEDVFGDDDADTAQSEEDVFEDEYFDEADYDAEEATYVDDEDVFEDEEDLFDDEDYPEVSTSPLPELTKGGISPRVLGYMEEHAKLQQRRASGGGLRMPSFLGTLKFGKKSAIEEEELPEAEDIPQTEAAEEAYSEPSEEIVGEATAETAEEPAEEAAGKSGFEWGDTAGDEDLFDDSDAQPADETVPEEDIFDEDGGTYAGQAFEEAEDGEYVAEDDSYDAYEDQDEEEEASGSRFNLAGLFGSFDFKALLQNRILKISAAATLIIAVLIGGIIWLNFVTTKRSKIVDVTYSTYTQGIEMLQAHISEEYRTSMTQVYLTNTGTANKKFLEDMLAINGFISEEPAANDPLFITTLTIVQDAIVDAIKADADAELNGKSAERAAISERDWLAIEDAISKIENARTPNELSSIVGNLESIVVPTASPTPAPTPDNRKTLSKGMMDDTDVRYMQNKLVNLGFLNSEPDGDFGAGTESAVKAFQRAAGLTADGIVTPAVLDAMEAPDAPHAPDSAAPSNPTAE